MTDTAFDLRGAVRRDRMAALDRQLTDDARHERSKFPELEPDGAEAFAAGLDEAACPYACMAPTDAPDFLRPLPISDTQKAAAWIRGYREAQAAQEPAK